jgi:hypothetical protein
MLGERMFQFIKKDLEDLEKSARPMSKKRPIKLDQEHDVAYFSVDSSDDSSEHSTTPKANNASASDQTTKSVDYSKMPPIFGGRVVDDRPYSERPAMYDPNFYKKPVIKNELKEHLIIKSSGDIVNVINTLISDQRVLEVKDIGFGYYSLLTIFTESQQGDIDALIKYLKDTHSFDEVYHDKAVQAVHCQP